VPTDRTAILEATIFPNVNADWPIDIQELARPFTPYAGPVEEDSFRDFLGVRTRCRYLPEPYAVLAGHVEGYPGTERASFHDIAEWAGVLRAVLDARERFTCIELGAGWGPWVVASATAARLRGITDVSLIAVEGSPDWLPSLREHFADNGLDAAEHTVIHAFVGGKDRRARGGGTPQVSLARILAGVEVADVVHMDIQGAELDAVRSARSRLTSTVRRLVVGTHGRRIEDELLTELGGQGFELEFEKVSVIRQEGPRFSLYQDGTQVWRNPRLVESAG
jgi:hypothetical protein